MGKQRRTALISGAVVVVLVAAGLGGWAVHQRRADREDEAARAAARSYVAAWSAGKLDTVRWAGAAGSDMAKQYAALVAGMGSAKPTARLGAVKRSGSTATATVAVSWALGPDTSWSYEAPVSLHESAGTWLVSPEGVSGSSLFAPVTSDAHLSLTKDQGQRADILGRGGAPIVTTGKVVDVGIEPSRVSDLDSLVAKVSQLTGVSAGPLKKAVNAASPNAFVPVITLRRADYDKVADQLQPLPGTVFRSRTQSLPLTRDFARALIGSVGPVTADIVKSSGGRYSAGDYAGVSGLQRQYDAQLAGRPSYTVSAVAKDGSGDAESTQLFHSDGAKGTPLRTTLDPRAQRAADAALSPLTVPGALVALDVKTGAVLAVANNPSNGLNSAMVGQYPPGSTLKVATTLALLKDGLRPTDTVDCPPTIAVGGRTFRNFEHEQLGAVPFSTDFKNSCNTAFVNASKRLGRGDLHAAAAELGLGGDWAAGLGAGGQAAGSQAFTGSIPVNTSAVDQAAAAFGQGRNLVSPMALAVMAGSVARGRFLAPTLVTDPKPSGASASGTATATATAGTTAGTAAGTTAGTVAGGTPATKQISTLHTLMRSVVVSGTAAGQLTGVPGGPIFAKTGTAEFGSASPPLTHGWLVGWQGNVAFAAFVEKGTSGATAAGPVVKRFLTALHS